MFAPIMVRLPAMENPGASSALSAMVEWVQGTMLGSAATALAIIAIACIGLRMLAGRMEVTRALTIVIGCFVLSGASSIARGIVSALEGQATGPEKYSDAPDPPIYPAAQPPYQAKTAPSNFDPYAGAALATQ